MANYHGTARTNYFRFLPDQLALLKRIFVPGIDIQVVHQDPDLISIISLQDGGVPSVCIDSQDLEYALSDMGVENADNIDDLDLRDVIHLLLPPGETLVVIETGSEKARYLVGIATRYDHRGTPIAHIDLNDIYEEGDTRAEY